MLFIDKSSKTIQEIAEIHFKSVRCMIWKRIGSSNSCTEDCLICQKNLEKRRGVSAEMQRIFEDEDTLRDLVLADPQKMKKINTEIFKELFGTTTYSDIQRFRKNHSEYKTDQKKEVSKRLGLEPLTKDEKLKIKQLDMIAKIIDYSGWFNNLGTKLIYGPYSIAKTLNLRSCTYCNRQYTLTKTTQKSDSGKLMRPQFDHWYSKEKFPLLALSFYNLIPSCPTCNSSVKGSKEFNIKSNIHPYVDDIIDQFKFGFDYLNTVDEYKVKFVVAPSNQEIHDKIKETLSAFKIDEVYDGHHPELEDLILTAKAYSPRYLKSLKSAFPLANLTEEQIYRFAFGTELNSKDFHKRPMSKFKHDILKELGIIS